MLKRLFSRTFKRTIRGCTNRNSSVINARGYSTEQQYTNDVTKRCMYEDYQLSKIGNREIVGFGMNGLPGYIDDYFFPFPAIRYRECTPELMAIREKERGDWRNLTIEEKKYLYRSSFRQTFSEFQAPNTDWKSVLGSVLLFLSFTLWFHIFIQRYVYKDYPASFSKEARIQQYYRQVAINNQPFTGNYRPPGADLRIHPKNKDQLEEAQRLAGESQVKC